MELVVLAAIAIGAYAASGKKKCRHCGKELAAGELEERCPRLKPIHDRDAGKVLRRCGSCYYHWHDWPSNPFGDCPKCGA
jgi:hypothetical protein